MVKRHSFLSAAALYLVVGLTALVGLATHLAKRENYTGDEPRYALYALSFNVEHKPVMSEQTYETFRTRPTPNIRIASFPFANIQGSSTPVHAVLMPLILAPLAQSCSIQQLRLVSFLAGLIGICFLARLFLSQKLPLLASLACLIPPALFVPSFPYYFQVIPEIYLFLLVSVAFWNLLTTDGESLRTFWPAIVCGCAAPFFHLRGIPLTVTVACYVAWRVGWRRDIKRPAWRPLVMLALIYMAWAVATIVYNRSIYGNIFGSVNTARPIINSETVAAIFLDFRHGLLVYAPFYLLSFAGLLAGLYRRQAWAFFGGLFLIGVIAASVGPYPGESYPGRFWVQAVPVLAICLVGFVQGAMAVWAKVATYLLLSAVSFANTILFIVSPGSYMSARSAPMPYERMFEIFPWIHLGFWIKVLGLPGYRLATACYLLAGAAIIAWGSLYRSRILSGLAIMFILVGYETHRARPIAPNTHRNDSSFVLDIGDPNLVNQGPIRLQLCPPWMEGCPPAMITVSDGKNEWNEQGSGTIVLREPRKWSSPLQLRIGGDAVAQIATDPTLIRVAINQSWLVKLW